MTDAEREYRAQWIRDAARDLLIAHNVAVLAVGCVYTGLALQWLLKWMYE